MCSSTSGNSGALFYVVQGRTGRSTALPVSCYHRQPGSKVNFLRDRLRSLRLSSVSVFFYSRQRLRGHVGGQEDLVAASRHAYQQLGAFTQLPDPEWWAVWRLARHLDIVEGARLMMDQEHMCLSCGISIDSGNGTENSATHAQVHPECMARIRQSQEMPSQPHCCAQAA